MGTLQRSLESILSQAGRISQGRLPLPGRAQAAAHAEEIHAVYRQLGGILPEFPMWRTTTGWDIEFNGLAVELDEYLHFNRYRAVTLASSLYAGLQRFPMAQYRAYCRTREPYCLKAGGYGGKWSNSSCEAQFGLAATNRDLEGNGSPRWKQRA